MREGLWSRRPRAPSLRSIARPHPAGKASKLSCVEAVAATLVIVGLRGRAEQLLTKFKWGPTFLFLNRELFTAYGRCANSAEVVLAQNECIARWESERAGPLLRLPPAGSGSEEESGEEGGEEGGEESDEEGGFIGRWTHTPKGQAETVGMMPPSESEESEESEDESAAASEAGDIDDRSSRPVFVDGGREEKEGEGDEGLVQIFGPKPIREAPTSNLAAVAAAEAAEAAAEAAAAEAAAAAAAADAAAAAEAEAVAGTGALERAMVEQLVLRRTELRGAGEFDQADGIAQRLVRAGVVLCDEGGDTSWSYGASV